MFQKDIESAIDRNDQSRDPVQYPQFPDGALKKFAGRVEQSPYHVGPRGRTKSIFNRDAGEPINRLDLVGYVSIYVMKKGMLQVLDFSGNFESLVKVVSNPTRTPPAVEP